MKTDALNIKNFTSYRAFLLAFTKSLRSKNPNWSYGSWAKRLGLKSTSSITKILSGERHPSEQTIERLVRYFRFNEKDAEYFRDLVRLGKAKKDPYLYSLIANRVSGKHPHGAIEDFDADEFATIANWYCFPIREMTRLDDFSDDAEWIQKRSLFKIKKKEVTQTIDRLLRLRLIEKKNGRLSYSKKRINVKTTPPSIAIQSYHGEMLENARVALTGVPKDKREFGANTFLLRKENLPKAKKLIQEFREKFIDLMEEDTGDEVYQIQIQLFPITRKVKK